MSYPTLCRALVGAAAATVVLAVTAGARATPSPTPGASPEPVIGGSQLASHGIVVDASPGVAALPTGLTASSWLVADLDTGAVLAAQDPHGRYRPASTLKVLTSMVLLPRIDRTAVIRVKSADIQVSGTRVGLVPGETYLAGQLFGAMLIGSASDATYALANAAGGIPATVAAMNAQARQLGALDTVAKTPDGVDADGQSSSAYDLALISRAALRRADFRGYVATTRAFVGPAGHTIETDSHNLLLGSYPGTYGVKNGFTSKALYTYVGVARRGGHTVLVTLMHANYTWVSEAKSLLDWGFAQDRTAVPVGVLVDPHVAAPTVARGTPSSQALIPAARGPVKPGSSALAQLAEAAAVVVLGSALLFRTRAVRRHRQRRPVRLPRA